MRRFIKLAFFCLIMCISISLFAQGNDVDLSGAVSSILDFLPAKYQKFFTILMTSLFVIEQILASTQKVKANSTFQLIASWVNKIYDVVKTKKP
jgi:hypothetical protein